MEPERWKKVERLHHAALELTESERASFLMNSCSDDDGLRQEIESLLTRETDAEQFLEVGALGGAATSEQGDARDNDPLGITDGSI